MQVVGQPFELVIGPKGAVFLALKRVIFLGRSLHEKVLTVSFFCKLAASSSTRSSVVCSLRQVLPDHLHPCLQPFWSSRAHMPCIFVALRARCSNRQLRGLVQGAPTFTSHVLRFNNDCGCRWVTIVKMVGDFSGILNLVGDRSPMTPMVVKPMLSCAGSD